MKQWWVVAVYAAFFAALNWPVLALVNRVEPRVLGMPFLVAWCLLWSLGISLFHACYLFTRPGDPAVGDEGESGGEP